MKKLLKFTGLGCLGLTLVIIVFGIIGSFFSDSVEENVESKKEDVVQENEKEVINDSIWGELTAKGYRIEKDEFKGARFIYAEKSPRYNDNNYLQIYISSNDEGASLRFKPMYKSNDWLFVQKLDVVIDGKPYPFNLKGARWQRDNSGGKIWEWVDVPVNKDLLLVLNGIAYSKESKVRYTGNQYYNDRVVTNKEKEQIKSIMNLYAEILKYKF